MKKALPVLATMLALTAGGAGLYMTQKPGGLRLAGDKLAVADYLPADTLALAAFPDPGKSLERWKTTDLYKIWTEPQVQAFLAKPLSKIPANPDLDGLPARIAALDPKSLFVALTALDEKENHPHLVGGFQFKGSKDDVERLLATPKKSLHDQFPAAKVDLVNYQDHAIETFDGGADNFLASVYLGDWYLVANDLALLKATVDRVDHRAPDTQPALSKDADFQTVGEKLPSGYETLLFGRFQPFATRIYALATASGQPVDPAKRAEADKIKAVGATSSIENGKIRDVVYLSAPGLKQDSARLQLGSLPLTSADTLFYLANVIEWPEKFAVPAGANPPAPVAVSGLAMLQNLVSNLGAYGITPETLRASFANEGSLQLDWPAASLQPSILASIEVRDQDAARKLVTQMTSLPLYEMSWQTTQAAGQSYYSITLPGVSMIQPTLTLGSKHLLLGLDASQVRDAVRRDGGTGPTLATSETYKAALGLVDKPNANFGYLDAKGLFERTYGLLRPYALMGAAFLPPEYTNYVDLAKLPDTETISKHLSPSIFSQTLDKDGGKLDSIGSVTFAQEIIGVTGVASAAMMSYYTQQAAATANRGATMRRVPATAQPGASPAGAAASPVPPVKGSPLPQADEPEPNTP